MKNKLVKRKIPMSTWFIISALIVPVINFLLFYITPNITSFTMAFRTYKGEWTLEHFARVFETLASPESDLRLAFRNTLLTFAIGLACYPFKVLVSYFIYKKIPFAGFYRIVFFIPSIVFGVAFSLVVMQLLSTNGIFAEWVAKLSGLDYRPELLADARYANWVVLLVMVWTGFPGDLILWGGTFARIPEEVLESGRIDGTMWWTEFSQIIVPMVWPTVGLQLTLSFAGILGASGNVFLLTGGQYGTITLSSWLYLQVYKNAGSAANSNALYYMSAVGICMTVIGVLLSRIVRSIADKMFDEVEF